MSMDRHQDLRSQLDRSRREDEEPADAASRPAVEARLAQLLSSLRHDEDALASVLAAQPLPLRRTARVVAIRVLGAQRGAALCSQAFRAPAPGPAPPRASAPAGAALTPEDVAAATLDTRDAGEPVDAALRARVEGALGLRLPVVRVHRDAAAQLGTFALGARAFAHGGDIFLGPGERPDDVALLTHELAHVAQQAHGPAAIQLRAAVGARGGAAERQADAVADAVEGGAAAPAVLVEDDAEALATGQQRKSAFLDALERAVLAATGEELGSLEAAAACPYIARAFAEYRGRPARDAEQVLRRYTRSRAATAEALIPDVIARLREGARAFRQSGQVPDDAPPLGPEAAARAGGLAEPGSPARLKAELGDGQALDARIGALAGAAYGDRFDDVRVHAGAAGARLAARHGATAVTFGTDIAFAPGAYRPGTLLGDALLAHELAHVAQQRGADPTSQGRAAAPESPAAEADADQAARGVVASLLGGAGRLIERLARGLQPAVRTGYALQRCIEPPTPVVLDGERAAREIAMRQLEIVPEPRIQPAVRGQSVRFRLTARPTLPPSTPIARAFGATAPDGSFVRGQRQDDGSGTLTFEQVGTYRVLAEYAIGNNERVILEYEQQVVDAQARADQTLDAMAAPSYERFRASLELRHLEMTQSGVQDQNLGPPGSAYISNSGPNPARTPHIYPHDVVDHTYTIHPQAGAQSFQWYFVPESLDHLPLGRARSSVQRFENGEGFSLGTGRTARLPMDTATVYRIYCEQRDAAGQLLGTARYVQVIQRPEQHAQTERWRQYMDRTSRDIARIRAGQAVGLRAAHVSTELGSVTELALFVGPDASDASRTMLVDLTPGAAFVDHPGASFDAALEHLRDNNRYPPGLLRIEVPTNTLGIPAGRRPPISTSGESLLGRSAGGFGWASLGLAGLGLLLAFTPAAAAAPYLFVAAAGAGGVSAGLSLIDHLRQAEVSGVEIAIDLAGLASSILGARAAFMALRQGAAALVVRPAGRFLLWSQFTADAVSGVLLGAQGAESIEAILGRTDLSPDQKTSLIVRILANLALNGGLLVYGARDLTGAHRRVGAALGAAAQHLPANTLHALGLLEDELLQRLARATPPERQRLLQLFRDQPEEAARLAQRYGTGFFDEALRAGDAPLAHIAERLAQSPGGATRGADVYTLGNTRTLPDGSAAGNLGPSRLRQALDRMARAPRARSGARLQVRGEVSSGTPPEKVLEATLTVPRGGATETVDLVIRSTDVLGAGSHGAESGPARLANVTEPAAPGGRWRAEIRVDSRLYQDDVPFAVGHEIDELSELIRGGHPPAAHAAEMEAGLFRRDPGTAPPITAHDRASAEELSAMYRDLERLRADPTTDPQRLARREQSVARLRHHMGLDLRAHLDVRLKVLMEAGAPEALLTDVRRAGGAALHGEFAAAGRITDPLIDMSLVTHAAYPEPHAPNPRGSQGTFVDRGLRGGHDDARLRAFIEAHPDYALVQEARRSAAGTTFWRYSQYLWIGPGPKPHPGHPDFPSPGQVYDASKWVLSSQPKTTVADLSVLMAEADALIRAWRAGWPGGTPPAGRGQITQISPRGVELTIMYNADTGTFQVSTVFIEARWLP